MNIITVLRIIIIALCCTNILCISILFTAYIREKRKNKK